MNPLAGHEIAAKVGGELARGEECNIDKAGVKEKGIPSESQVERSSPQEMSKKRKGNIVGDGRGSSAKIERPVHDELPDIVKIEGPVKGENKPTGIEIGDQKERTSDIPTDLIKEDPATPEDSVKNKDKLKIERPVHEELPDIVKKDGPVKSESKPSNNENFDNESSKIEIPNDAIKTDKTTNNSEQIGKSEAEKDKPETTETFQSSYEERLQQTPKEGTERGEWEGERGESKFIPNDEKVKEILSKYGLDGITYKDGIPDFSECAESTVEIDNMSENRAENFRQCDEKCAEQWNKEGRDGRTDWTARDVKKWREENGYSWHERNDMKTCDLVPTKVNDYFGHLGGVSECKKRDAKESGGEFDE